MLLNQKFHGRVLARAIFFLPVILASGIIASIENGDLMQSVVRSASDSTGGGLSVIKNLEPDNAADRIWSEPHRGAVSDWSGEPDL